MSPGRRLALIAAGIILGGVATGEHLFRRQLEHRYRAAEARREELQGDFDQLRARHERVNAQLTEQRQHAEELLGALAERTGQLEEAVGRLTVESRTVRELESRLVAMARQMDSLQGELSLAMDRVGGKSKAAPSAVQLERILISSGPQPDGLRGRVVSVDTNWHFVVINLGWDAVKIGDTVSILRNGHMLAQARIERVQEGVAAASLLPEWEDVSIQVNDLVRVL